MSKQLHQALTNILAMPYYKNEHARSGVTIHGHEDAVALKLSDTGFTEINKSVYPGLSKSILKEWAETGNDVAVRYATKGMAVGTFINQPAGSQGFPDILVKDYNDRFVAFECKSGQAGECPMWNDNIPKPNSIYILSSGNQNATTIFLGKDVITQATYDLFAQQEAEIELIVQKYKSMSIAADSFNRGWVQKSRKQHFQAGGGALTNYFTHSDRAKCEQNALVYAKQ
jgi:hypothetical protein